MIQAIGNDYKINRPTILVPFSNVKNLPSFTSQAVFPASQERYLDSNYLKALYTQALSFDETMALNFFKLPVINGVQAMPDKTQLEAAKSLYEGKNTVCVAPTGTGKTAIANYIITKNLGMGKKTSYTTPLKALSNDKYREFCKIYGEENVGLLTGDIKLKKDAPILIMTTEIFRNMALANYSNPQKKRFKDVATVVFDEAHYISEPERGKIWEESIMLAPKGIQMLPLSATVGNAEQFSNWIGSITDKTTQLIEADPKERHVPLVYYDYAPDNKGRKLQELVRAKVNPGDILEASEKGALTERQERAISMLEAKTGKGRGDILKEFADNAKGYPMNHGDFQRLLQGNYKFKPLEAQEISQLLIDEDTKKINANYLSEKELDRDDFKAYNILIKDLEEEKKLPAIIFKFSRKGCNDSARDVLKQGVSLTSEEEKEKISQTIEKYVQNGIYLGKYFNRSQLLQGVASHNAGLMPGYKKLVEELFSQKLLKVVFATSTLSAGINMPARSVVITQLEKPDKDDSEDVRTKPLSANEFHQMAGRAGRRGIDTIGNVILYGLKQNEQDIAKNLVLTKANPLVSKYSPTYNFLASYYGRSDNSESLKDIMEKTFQVYQAPPEQKEATVKALQENLKSREKILERLGFLEKISDDGYKTTTKGAMLTKAHGYNEIVLVDMIHNKKLEALSPVELASFASQMVGEKAKFSEQDITKIADVFSAKCQEDGQENILDVISDSMDYDEELQTLEGSNLVEHESEQISLASAYLGYLWAQANEQGEDSIEAFKGIVKNQKNKGKKEESASKNILQNLYEGDAYSILSQSVDVLKQIINISEFALETPELQEDTKYYENLIQTAQKSLELIKKPPIHDSLSVA